LNFINNSNLRVLTDVALPRYLSQSVEFLKARADGSTVDLQAVFLEINSQLMGKMAYNVRQARVLRPRAPDADRPTDGDALGR